MECSALSTSARTLSALCLFAGELLVSRIVLRVSYTTVKTQLRLTYTRP